MKISAMILTYNEEEYLPYCLESLKNFVDEIVVMDGMSTDRTRYIIMSFQAEHPEIEIKWIVDPKKDDYAYLRNRCLDSMTGDWCVWLDGDEVIADKYGKSLKREDVERLLVALNEMSALDVFTIHFMYNYFTIDGRNNGTHFSQTRIFKIDKNWRFKNKMHEILELPEGTKTADITGLVIYHFGMVKTPEATRRKYAQCIRIYPEWFKGMSVDEYCRDHELFRGTRPTIRFNGHLPECMHLW